MRTCAPQSKWIAWPAVSVVFFSGCIQQMADQPRVDVWEPNEVLLQNESMRKPVEGTVARGQLPMNDPLLQGTRNGKPVETFPNAVDADTLDRGRQRFAIFCTPCHGATGDGLGSVVERGFPRPPSYHTDRLRDAPAGHLFDVITNGIGRMPRFSDRIPPRDRWAIAAYIRALQLSQYAELNELPPSEQKRIRDELP